MDIELRNDPHVTTQDRASAGPVEAKDLHQWSDAESSDPVTVAVMDTGIDPQTVETHPWFGSAELAQSYDATQNNGTGDAVGHGTGVASIYSRYAGGPVRFVSVRIFGTEGRTGFEAIERGYNWLIQNASSIDVVNLSWGASRDVPAIDHLHSRLMDTGVVDVVAAGNSGSEGGSPSTTPGAFSAGAVTIDGEVTRFSSYDPNQDNPDVMGVGKNVRMARANGTSMGKVLSDDFVKSSGTSFSAPLVGAAVVEALRAGKSQVVRSFERAAKNLPGRRDGAGVMKLAPAIEDPGQDSTEATAWNFNGSDMLFLEDVNWLPSVDDARAEKVEETADHITLRLQK